MSVDHQIIGYDRDTEQFAHAHLLPSGQFLVARDIANVPPEDEEAIGCYPLSQDQALRIAGRLGAEINVEAYDWFLEPTQDG